MNCFKGSLLTCIHACIHEYIKFAYVGSIYIHACIYHIYILFMFDFVQLRALEKSLRKKKKDAEAAADMEE